MGLAVGLDEHVGKGDVVRAASQRLPSALSLVDGQDALYEELGLRGLRADMLDECDDMLSHLLGCGITHHVVDACHEEDGLGLEGSNLIEALGHAHGVVADDATIHNLAGGADALLPVLTVLSEAVAQHDDGGGVDATLALELSDALLVMVAPTLYSRTTRSTTTRSATSLGISLFGYHQ